MGPIHKALKSTTFSLMQKIFILKDLEGLSEFCLLAPVEVLGLVEGVGQTVPHIHHVVDQLTCFVPCKACKMIDLRNK